MPRLTQDQWARNEDERLSRAARRMWREALGVPADAPAGRGEAA